MYMLPTFSSCPCSPSSFVGCCWGGCFVRLSILEDGVKKNVIDGAALLLLLLLEEEEVDSFCCVVGVCM